ncbi:hypothetical protein GTO10_02200 [Candidatus Saccharibacteria bacterium]|nr:hypothetical protein [Candidatus Saccharibacteria bacterium]
MLLTPHVAAGMAIGAAIPDPKIAVPLAFASHFVLDAVPHWDEVGLGLLEKRFKRISRSAFKAVLFDFLVALSLALFLIYFAMPDFGVAVTLGACFVASILPDIYYLPLAFFGKRWGTVMWVVRMQNKLQTAAKAPKAFGLLTQGVLVVICLLIELQQILVQLPQTWRIH